MTPVNALFPVSSTGNGLTYEGWSSKSDAFTSLATAGGTSAGIGSSIELLRSTAAQCPETSAVVISSTPAWCDCCVLTLFGSNTVLYGTVERRARSAHTGRSRGPFIHSCFKRDFYGNRYSYSISTVVSFLRSPAISAVCARSFAPCWRGRALGGLTAVQIVQR